jgi:hypothetical protein
MYAARPEILRLTGKDKLDDVNRAGFAGGSEP